MHILDAQERFEFANISVKNWDLRSFVLPASDLLGHRGFVSLPLIAGWSCTCDIWSKTWHRARALLLAAFVINFVIIQ